MTNEIQLRDMEYSEPHKEFFERGSRARFFLGDRQSGKTEVASRAAVESAANGNDVVVLTPTHNRARQLRKRVYDCVVGSPWTAIENRSLVAPNGATIEFAPESIVQTKQLRGRVADVVVDDAEVFSTTSLLYVLNRKNTLCPVALCGSSENDSEFAFLAKYSHFGYVVASVLDNPSLSEEYIKKLQQTSQPVFVEQSTPPCRYLD